MRIALLTILFLTTLCAQAQDKKDDAEKEKPTKTFKFVPEFKIQYNKQILNKDFDFTLKATDTGKFTLSYFNTNERYVTVRIYDFIGNLILQERVPTKGVVNREYDLSFSKNKMFIVEVGNAKYNKTKSVMAI